MKKQASLSVHTPYTEHCIKLVPMAIVPEGNSKHFALDKQSKSINNWNYVQWSDETKINVFGSDGVGMYGSPLMSTR